MPGMVVNTYHKPMKNCIPTVHIRKREQSKVAGLTSIIQPVRHKARIQTHICLPQGLSFKTIKRKERTELSLCKSK